MHALLHHRINTLAQLHAMPPSRGAEIDLRSDVTRPSSLHLSHDPYMRGEDLAPWLDAWCEQPRGPLLLNTKEDGLEEVALSLCQERRIDNVIFLDTQIPTLVKFARKGFGRHLSVRLSRFESAAWLSPWIALDKECRPRLLWVDCFDREPLPASWLTPLRSHFEICMVSPDLQGNVQADFSPFVALAKQSDMICSKRCDEWSALLTD